MKKRFALSVAALAVASFGAAAHAAVHPYSFTMNGPSENPPNASPGTGTGTAFYDDVAHTLTLSASFSGLVGNVTQTHFHAVTTVSGLPDNNPPGETADQAAAAVPNVGIAIGNPSLPGFPLGVMNGVYAQVLDLTQASIYNAGYLSANGDNTATAEATFANALATGRTYWNIHSNIYPGGEIRGFPVLIPEPATVVLALLGMGLVCARGRRN